MRVFVHFSRFIPWSQVHVSECLLQHLFNFSLTICIKRWYSIIVHLHLLKILYFYGLTTYNRLGLNVFTIISRFFIYLKWRALTIYRGITPIIYSQFLPLYNDQLIILYLILFNILKPDPISVLSRGWMTRFVDLAVTLVRKVMRGWY